ncbi:hypothetical protein EV421DRAFT_1981875 [Armillaria borealis]|uniref:F-box domain-containing protein n=1 Tax=Armillaria borealis TaxID=47425 RepID=A0AA39MJ06_9AGAR|nr:hypothetical protein EV421DRAFT_1981875 [Armillaria borealis]
MPQLGDEYLIPAHVSMYLENNDAPHDIEMAYITKYLRDIGQSIDKADEDEKELSRALETLRKRRAAMLRTQSKLRSIISPLRRFPAEILSEIFQHTVEQDGYSVLNTSDGPWSLSRVSRHWRATALTCSGALWSNLYISIYGRHIHQTDPLSLVRTCLTRSRRHKISVYFDYPERVPIFEDKAKEIFQLLIDNCKRWQSLEISHQCLGIHSILGKARGRLRNLENLVIHRGPVRTSPITAFELAPRLRTVKIHGGIDVVLGPGNPSLISYEDYRSPPTTVLDSYFAVLRSCRQHLQTFTSLHVSVFQRLRAENPPIILPRLKHFRGSHEDLIESVTTPNLETFHLDNSHFVLANSLLNVRDLFIRSGCLGISKLTLSNNMITSHILDIMSLVPALAVLRFQFYYWGNRHAEGDIFRSMFQQMTDIDEVGTPKVVPNLREFSFAIVPPGQRKDPHFTPVLCFDGIFVDMVASRAKTLEKVEVRASIPSDNWSPVEVSVFESLLEDGMDISLKVLGPWDFSL